MLQSRCGRPYCVCLGRGYLLRMSSSDWGETFTSQLWVVWVRNEESNQPEEVLKGSVSNSDSIEKFIPAGDVTQLPEWVSARA